MNDEAAESRGPATTGAGSSQDAPAPSAAPASDSAPAPADAAETTAPTLSAASAPGEPTASAAEGLTATAAPAASGAENPLAPAADEPTTRIADEPTTPAADEPTTRIAGEPTTPLADEPTAHIADEPTTPAADEPTTRIAGEPTAPLTDGLAGDVPPAWTPPAPGAPPSADPPPPPPPGSTPPPGAGGPPPAAPPPWFGEGGPSFSRERLVRPTRGRYVAGVCSALGRATNTDPVLWRVLLVVLGLFGGVGMLIYLIGWLVIPGEGDAVSPIESLLGRGRSAMAPFSVVLLGAATVLTFAFIVHDGFRATLLGGAVLVGVALLIRRNTGAARSAPVAPSGATSGPAADPSTGGAAFPFAPMDRTTAFAAAGAPSAAPTAGSPAPGGPAATTAPAGEPVTAPLPPRPPGYQPPRFTPPPPSDYRAPFAPHGPYAGHTSAAPPRPPRPPRPPKPPRERSKLGRITFFAVLMVLGVLALIDVAAASVSVSAYFAAALATIGLGLLVGAWFGRARGLIMLALIATLGLAISSGVERFGGQVANSNYQPQSISQVADRYDFKVGDVTLDLRAVDFTGVQQDTTVTMDLGQVRVLLPDNVDTSAGVAVENGRVVAFGREYAGQDTRSIKITDLGADGTGGGTLRLTIQVKAGNVEVSR